VRSQGPQYYYQPPGSGANILEKLKPLVQPPLAYLVFLVGVVLGIWLSVSGSSLAQYGPRLLILLIAFPVHELAHALVADRLGDSTPRFYGRITLNPLAQLNFIGSLMMILIGIGWAYVPITPGNLRPNARTGHMLVAAAGPIANLILAGLCAVLWHTMKPALEIFPVISVNNVFFVLSQFAWINIALFFFNLVPLVPLDGFFVLKGLLPYSAAYQLEKVQRYGMFAFLAIFFIAPLMGLPILNWLIFNPASAVTKLLFLGF
jgi:Zn-dependent protease